MKPSYFQTFTSLKIKRKSSQRTLESVNNAIALSPGNVRGAALMTMSMAGFAINDGLVKLVGQALPLGQVLLIRGLFATGLVFVLAWAFGQLRPLTVMLSPILLVRTFAEIVATLSFLTALVNMPIANASAIMQAMPLVVTVGAALFFGEQVGWRRISAILAGLFGVFLVVRPGLEGFNSYSLYCLITVLASAVRDLITRKLDKDVPSLFVSLATASFVTLTGGILCLFTPWQPVSLTQTSLLAAASIFIVIAFFGIVAAMREGEVGFVSPFRYFMLLFSVIIGLLIFSEIPDFLTITGSAIVVASGIYTIYRERFYRRQDITQPPVR